MRIAGEINHGGYTWYSLPDDMRSLFPTGYDLGVFRDGQMAMFYGGAGLLDTMINQVTFDWDFIGTPGGRAVATLDIVGISAITQHPQEAYELARWMGHGTEGSLRRLEYARQMGIVVSALPVTQSQQVIESLLESVPAEGLRSIYNSLERVLTDGIRVLPGYMQARFSAPTGVQIPGTAHNNAGVETIIRYAILGYVDFADFSALAEQIAQEQLDMARIR